MADKWIYRFEELGQEYNDIVGKKCANLAEMGKAGLANLTAKSGGSADILANGWQMLIMR